jgi:hypothetical protein
MGGSYEIPEADRTSLSGPRPSVGRIVHYWKNQHRYAAIITDVFDNSTVHLTLFSPGLTQYAYDVPFATENGDLTLNDGWRWPERV